MTMTREEKIARIQKLERIKQLEAKKFAAPPKDDSSDTSTMENVSAGIEGFGQGATLGYMPQIQGALESGIESAIAKGGDLINGTNEYENVPGYTQRRDEWADHYKKLNETNPLSYNAGQIGGAVVSGLAIPGATLAKGATLATKLRLAGVTGAAYRGLSNPGENKGEVDPLQLQDRFSAAADPLGIAIDLGIPGAGNAAKNVAETSAFKALGPYARDLQKKIGTDKVQKIGREVLDSNAFGWLPKSYESLAERLGNLKQKSWDKLSGTIDDMAAKEVGQPVGVSRQSIARNLEQELISPDIDLAGVADRNNLMKKNISNFERGGLPESFEGPIDDSIKLSNAEMKKRAANAEINYNRLPGADIPDAEKFNRALQSQLRQGVEEGGEQLALKTGFDIDKFRQLKGQYGNFAEATSIAETRNAKDFANRFLSPSDYAAGGMGAAVGALRGGDEAIKNTLLGAGLGLVNKGFRLYGNQGTARLMNNTGRVLNSAASNPLVTQGVLSPMKNDTWKSLYDKKEKDKKK